MRMRSGAVVAVLGLFLALVSAGLVWRHDQVLRLEQRALLQAMAGTVADQVGLALDYGIPFPALRGMEPFLETVLAADPALVAVTVRDAGGTPLFQRGPSEAGGLLTVAVPIQTAGGITGRVELTARGGGGLPPGLLVALALVGAWALGAAALLHHFYRLHRIERPLAQIAARLEAAARGDFSAPPFSPGGDRARVALGRQLEALFDRVNLRAAAFRQEMEELSLAQPDPASREAMIRLRQEGLAGRRFRAGP